MRNLNAYANRAMEMLDAIGIEYGNIVSWKVNTRAHSRWGQTAIVPGGFSININADLLNEQNSEKGLINTLCHELLHTCRDCWNHGAEWQRLAEIVNDCYILNIKRCSTAEEKGVVVVTEAKATREYIIECPCCGARWVRHRMNDFVKFPEFYTCGNCHATLKRIK